MKKGQYQTLLRPIVEKYRRESWEYWRARIGAEPITFEDKTEDGKEYQIEVEAFWDGEPEASIRVLISIDDGGWRAWCPVCESFIITPESSCR
jgi:hypothetical protein